MHVDGSQTRCMQDAHAPDGVVEFLRRPSTSRVSRIVRRPEAGWIAEVSASRTFASAMLW